MHDRHYRRGSRRESRSLLLFLSGLLAAFASFLSFLGFVRAEGFHEILERVLILNAFRNVDLKHVLSVTLNDLSQLGQR